MSGNEHRADLTVFVGATGSGKTLLTKGELRERLATRPGMVWSWKEKLDRYAPTFGVLVERLVKLEELVKAGRSVVYLPARASDELVAKQFDFFCRLALDVGNRAVLVEEMSVVADSRSSPAAWKLIVSEGRGHGLVPMATTQRPQLCDSTILDAATVIYCGRLNRLSSQKIMADTMGGLDIARLRGLQELQFLRWQTGLDAVELVTVEIPGKRKKRA